MEVQENFEAIFLIVGHFKDTPEYCVIIDLSKYNYKFTLLHQRLTSINLTVLIANYFVLFYY